MKKITATMLMSLMLASYSTPLMAQNQYEVVPPVNNNTENYVTSMPDIQQNTDQQAPLEGRLVTAPTGTSFEVVTNSTINSLSSQVGDMVTAKLDLPLIIDSKTVIPAGSEMIGQITYVQPAGRIGRNALMDLRFTSIKLPNGERVPVNARVMTTDSSGVLRGGNKSNIIVKAVGTTAGTTAVGAVAGVSAGAILGSVGTGVLFGTAVGGLAGLGYAIYRKGKDIILPSGTKMGVTLEQALTVSSAKVEN